MGDVIEILTTATNTVEVEAQGPQGPAGSAGPANTLSIGTVTSGVTASATISGNAPSQTLSLVLPKGDKGDTGPQGPEGAGISTLTTKGDLLSRDDSEAIRVGIGSTGQILKVSAQGLPTWANESGAVTSVNGATGAVTVAAATHAVEHEFDGSDPLQAKAALVETDIAALNGVYFWDGTTTSGRPNFFRTGTRKNTKIVYNSGTGQWNLVRNLTIEAVGVDGPSTVPWDNTWEEFVTPTSVSVTQLPLETMVQKLAETGGTATATTSDDGLMSSSDKTKLNGIATGAEVNVQANWTEADSGSDAFIQNKPSTFAPSAHKNSHSVGQSDALAPSDIGAQSVFQNVTVGPVSGDTTLTAYRAARYNILNFTGTAVNITLPTASLVSGDVAIVSSPVMTGGGSLVIRRLNADASYTTLATITKSIGNNGETFRFHTVGTSGADWRLDVVPNHGSTHASNGADPLTLAASQITSGSFGNISHDGKIGSTAGLPLVTTTAGAVTTLALGTANQILRVNSGATGVEFADPAAAGVSSVSSSASDVLGVSGANITGVDANADRIVYWNNTSNKLAYGTPADAGAAAASHTHTSADINSQTASNGHVLTANGSGGASFAALPASGISNVDSTLADVMSVSGSNLVADDGGLVDSSNPALVWDDAAGKAVWANPLRRTSAGAFYVGVAPTTTAIGTRAINIQADRSLAADRVAQGTDCVVVGNSAQTANISAATAIGFRARANNTYATCIGGESLASGYSSIAIGAVAVASGAQSINISAYDAYGGNSSSATNSVGLNATADLRAMFATAAVRSVYWGGQTTNNTATILNLDATATNRFTIAANTALAVDILLVARRSDVADKWLVARRFLGIRRDGSNNTSLIGTVQNFGMTDQSGGSPTWSFALTADDTNDALQLEVTGATGETVQWRACAIYRVV